MIKNNRYYWSHLKTKTATISVRPKRTPRGVVFRVGNMIDLGTGRQTVMLDSLQPSGGRYCRSYKQEVAVPFRMGDIDFVYTARHKPAVQDVYSFLSSLYKKSEIEKIVVDVLCPGDLIVFQQERSKEDQSIMGLKMVEVLRVVNDHLQKQKKANNAF